MNRTKGILVLLFCLVFQSGNRAQQPAAGANINPQLTTTRPNKTVAKEPEVSVVFEERLLGTMPAEYEDVAVAGVIQVKLTKTSNGTFDVHFKVGPPVVVCFPTTKRDYDL